MELTQVLEILAHQTQVVVVAGIITQAMVVVLAEVEL
jgi:hypothetical protein